MDDKHCDMCVWYDMHLGYCDRYKERHYLTDGEGCIGWEYLDDPFNSVRRMENDRKKETP